MRLRSELPAAIAAGMLAVLLSGCTGAEPAASDPETTTETIAPVATTQAEPTEPSEASIPAQTCETVLTETEYASLAEDHLVLREPYLLGPVMERMAAEGALVCEWAGQGGDVAVWYARLDVGGEGEAWLAEIAAEGWLEDTARGEGTYLAPADYDPNYQPSVLLRDGVLHFVSYNPFFESVLELQ